MIDLALNDAGDLSIAGGDLQLIDGVDAVMQHVRIRFRTIQGEWFADVNAGFPHNEIVGERIEPSLIKLLFERFVRDCIGVLRIDNFNATFDPYTRTYSVTGDIVDVDGNVIAISEPFTPGGIT